MVLEVERLQFQVLVQEEELAQRGVPEWIVAPQEFFNILDFSHRSHAVDLLLNGQVIALECLGPFGFMVAINPEDGLAAAERQVDELGLMKGRDMSQAPAPIFAPSWVLDNLIDYSAMTRGEHLTSAEVQKGLRNAMLKSGAFFEVVLKSPYDQVIPYNREIDIKEQVLKTAVVACLDGSYPALAEIVNQVWERGQITHITSANLHGKQETLTTAKDVWDTFSKKYPDLMILDNPLLESKLVRLGIRECSYTLVHFATGLHDRGGVLAIDFRRQGNVSPEWVANLLTEHLGIEVVTGEVGKILADNPFFRAEMGDNSYEPFAGVLN